MKVTLITTVKNEESSIKNFLESVKKQTKKPDEIIVVDGGSNDETVKRIKNYGEKINSLRIVIKKGNRSVGRNTAVKNSSNEIIACTDAGCILDKNWLGDITKPFEDQTVDVVAGFYKPKTSTVFEKCLSTYTCVMSDKLNPNNFLPSSRSIAFKKSAWRKIGGYPEYLDTCEDLVFAKKLKQRGFKFRTIKKAFVYWPQRKNISQAARQFFIYAKGDGQARFFRKTTPFLFLRYIMGIILVVYIAVTHSWYLFSIVILLLAFYIAWAIYKNYRYVRKWQAFFYLPTLQFISDWAVLSGTIVGYTQGSNWFLKSM